MGDAGKDAGQDSASSWVRMRRLPALCLLLASVAWCQQEEINPSKPTNLYSNIDFNFEFQNHPGDGDLYGINIIPAIAFNDRNRLDAEIPILSTTFREKPNTTGLGDIRLRYFHLRYKTVDQEKRITAAGVSVDVFLPRPT